MKIIVLGHTDAWESLKKNSPDPEWIRAEDAIDLLETKDADAYFNLEDDSAELTYAETSKPVFINSATDTILSRNFSNNVIRINGWNGFLQKDIWEVAGHISEEAKKILSAINKKYIVVKDDPGFITPRVISMIINEAFFAKGEGVSTEEEIDIAMKLGTNYPFGPFEWSKKIGLKNIYTLLKTLSLNDERYTPAPEMERAVNNIL